MILAGDVGATKILLEIGEIRSDRWEPLLDRRYSTGEAENFAIVLKTFLDECAKAGVGVKKLAAAAIGVGTGLGIAYLIPTGDGGYRALPGEGGHAGFAPATPAQLQLWRAIFSQRGRVSAEDIISGPGLPRIHAALRGAPVLAEDMSAEQIATAAETGDSCSVQTLDLFSECLGNVAGDHALALLARGGVYLAGGVIVKLLPKLNKDRFREAFCAKSPHSALMMKIPVKAAASDRLAILGAAKIAATR